MVLLPRCDVYGDKGFIGQDWQAQITDSTGNYIWTIQRSNQERQVCSTNSLNKSII